MSEQWKVIPEYSAYSISDTGVLKNNKRDTILKPVISERGYVQYRVYDNDKNKKTIRASRYVWETFNDCKCENVIDHIDDNILNNHLSNLQCITQKKNSQKRTIYRYNPPSEELKKEIMTKIKIEKYSLVRISKEYGYGSNYICNVLKRGSWDYLLDESKTIR